MGTGYILFMEKPEKLQLLLSGKMFGWMMPSGLRKLGLSKMNKGRLGAR